MKRLVLEIVCGSPPSGSSNPSVDFIGSRSASGMPVTDFASGLLVITVPRLKVVSHVLAVYELRIYDGAERGTRLTMDVNLQKRFETVKNCFGQLETDVEWIEYQSVRSAFYTTVDLTAVKLSNDLSGTLHLLCTGNQMHSLQFRVHVTHRNHHPPTFSKSHYQFFVPITLPVGGRVGEMEVHDNDPVIYNSERSLDFTRDQQLFTVHEDGSLFLKEELINQIAFKPLHMEVLAIDYGSPQLFSIANLTVIPVTVSQVERLRVNVATEDYQIFEWDAPSYGKPMGYRLSIANDEGVQYEEELDGGRTVALRKAPLSSSGNFSFNVAAIDSKGETPSEWQRFVVIQNECASGGVPLCYHGPFNRVEQFVDHRGPHCQCFYGFIGVSCDKTAQTSGHYKMAFKKEIFLLNYAIYLWRLAQLHSLNFMSLRNS
ncbi:fibronectin type III domain protein [Dictyocaulus viviparus]|uniref:Fibronectin type III domain protein n=1 Tax=Dictyocaulus viviparus TaxID=29172 RepID=A0A0D8XKS8_DICVI|nr:fibronectin type III domain protein [Dictyocaulus viviparus]